jgi:hypothetical protein
MIDLALYDNEINMQSRSIMHACISKDLCMIFEKETRSTCMQER